MPADGLLKATFTPHSGLMRLSLTPPIFPAIAVELSSSRQTAGLAQLAEQLICNQQVGGSNPSAGTIFQRLSQNRGFVRLIGCDLADLSRYLLSRGEMAPFSERGSTVLLKDIAAVEMAV